MKENKIAAAILAGGRNSRMGGFNKAFIRINGVPVVKISIALLKNIFEEIIIVTNSPDNFKSYRKEAIITEDLIKGAGPLGGIHSALSVTSKSAVFFVACDMPFLHNALINRLIKHFNGLDCAAVVPRINSFIPLEKKPVACHGVEYTFNEGMGLIPRPSFLTGFIEPLHAIYRSSLKGRLGSFLRRGSDYSIKGFLRGENVEYFDLEDNSLNKKIFRNLNTPDDLSKTMGARWR